MKRGYTVEDYREMLARIRETVPGRRGDERLHRRLLRRDGRRLPADDATWCASPVQEQLHLQVQRAARHEGRRAVRRRRAGGGEAPPQQRAARAAERDQRSRQPRVPRPAGRGAGRRPEQGGRKTCARRADRQPTSPADSPTLQLTGRTHCDRIVVFDGNRRQIGQILPVVDLRRQRPHAVRRSGDAARRARSCSRSPYRRSDGQSCPSRWNADGQVLRKIGCRFRNSQVTIEKFVQAVLPGHTPRCHDRHRPPSHLVSTTPTKPSRGCVRCASPICRPPTPTSCGWPTHGVTLDLLSQISEQFAAAAPTLADPDMAINNLERFIAASRNPLATAALFERDPRRAAEPAADFFHQPVPERPAGRRQRELRPAADDRRPAGRPRRRWSRSWSPKSARSSNDAEVLAALRRFKRRETLRIAYGDIVRGQPVETVTRQISYLADAIVEAALDFARRQLRRAVRPAAAAATASRRRFVVLGLGKLGGARAELFQRHRPDVSLRAGRPDRRPPHGQQSGVLRAAVRRK